MDLRHLGLATDGSVDRHVSSHPVLRFARGIWRRLPTAPRRAFAHGLLTAFAPRLSSPPPAARQADAPVIIVGFLTSASGLGQASRLAYIALQREGRAVLGVDLSRYFFETSDVVRFDYADGRAHRGPGHVLININAPYLSYVFQLLGSRFWGDKYVTGYWAWELPTAPASWREGLARVHDIATPSTFVAQSLQSLGTLPPVRVIPHPVAIEAPPPTQRARDGRFEIVSTFNVASGFERKNPIAAISAFKRAAGGDSQWRLRLLASNAEHYEPGRKALLAAAGGDPRIEISFEALDRDAYWRWYGAPDLYVSLHRSEGFGLTLAEAMLAEAPVLATNWSGNTDFMSAENSMPVRYRLIPVTDRQAKYQSASDMWADPDIDHAAELMRRAFEEPDWARGLARRARLQALERWSRFPL